MNIKLLIIASLFLYGQNAFAQDLLARQAVHDKKPKSLIDEDAANVDASLIPISDYFFPLQNFYYITELVGENAKGTFVVNEYKISDSATIGLCLENKTEIHDNVFSHTTTAQSLYVISKSKTKNAVISTHQVYNNVLGTQTYDDCLTLFILPKKGQVEKWVEVNRGERVSCTAEYVEISYFVNGKEQNATSVKITKITKDTKNKDVKEWSYWVPKLSKIASFMIWGTSKVMKGAMSCLLDSNSSVKEIGPSLKLSYEGPKTATKKPISKTTRKTSSRKK